jgi:hypothetical protein
MKIVVDGYDELGDMMNVCIVGLSKFVFCFLTIKNDGEDGNKDEGDLDFE